MDRRSDIHRRVGDAIKEEGKVSPELLKEIQDFNKDYPEYPITGDSIKKSYRSRQQQHQRQEFGVALNPRLNARLRGDEAPAIYN
jgi:hypothetical protein